MVKWLKEISKISMFYYISLGPHIFILTFISYHIHRTFHWEHIMYENKLDCVTHVFAFFSTTADCSMLKFKVIFINNKIIATFLLWKCDYLYHSGIFWQWKNHINIFKYINVPIILVYVLLIWIVAHLFNFMFSNIFVERDKKRKNIPSEFNSLL